MKVFIYFFFATDDAFILFVVTRSSTMHTEGIVAFPLQQWLLEPSILLMLLRTLPVLLGAFGEIAKSDR